MKLFLFFSFYVAWALIWTWIFQAQEKPEQDFQCAIAKKEAKNYKVH